MARMRVIILDQTPDDPNTYNCLFWADVPPARQTYYANPNLTSKWNAATTADNQALQSGAVTEIATVQRVPPGTPLAQIEQFMQNQWQAIQANITNANPWLHYGSTWDGTTWTVTSNP